MQFPQYRRMASNGVLPIRNQIQFIGLFWAVHQFLEEP